MKFKNGDVIRFEPTALATLPLTLRGLSWDDWYVITPIVGDVIASLAKGLYYLVPIRNGGRSTMASKTDVEQAFVLDEAATLLYGARGEEDDIEV